jgi:hypothetical protein
MLFIYFFGKLFEPIMYMCSIVTLNIEGGKEMKKKIVGIFISMLVITSGIVIIIDKNEVKASAGGGGEGAAGEIGLNTTFVWRVLQELCNVTHANIWSGENNIPKGRCWATAGENYTILEILKPAMEIDCGLDEVHNIAIEHVIGMPTWRYSSKVVPLNFRLTINHQDYPYPATVPIEELFVAPTGVTGLNWNYSFQNAYLRLKNFTDDTAFVEPVTYSYLNLSCEFSDEYSDPILVGNVSYIDENDSIPADTDCQIFLIKDDSNDSNCQYKIDNMTNASGCILIVEEGKSIQYANFTNCSFYAESVENNTDNLSDIIDLLESGKKMIVSNFGHPEILTFMYDIVTSAPSEDYLLLNNIPTAAEEQEEGKNYLSWLYWVTQINRVLPHFQGVMIYDYNETHYMFVTTRDWFHPGWGNMSVWPNNPAMPIYSINYSAGNWIRQHYTDTTVSGFINQQFRQQTFFHPGVISHNIVGYRNISRSPDDKIVIINNRMDGWWSETPGDSGAGGAMALGIAKYFNEYNIIPKYNLTFLFTTGEEYGCRGGFHYLHTHEDDNVVTFISLDQVGFNQPNSNLEISYKNETYINVLKAIINDTHYTDRTSYEVEYFGPGHFSAAEDEVWVFKPDCFPMSIAKDGNWYRSHRSGLDYSEGDALQYTDRNDINITFELAWNITKYFTVNPNCWFDDISYESYDSTGEANHDSIRATYTIQSTLPSDLVMVKADFRYSPTQEVCETTIINLTANRTGITNTVTFTMPEGESKGEYEIKVYLYNSTGRINEIIDMDGLHYNETITSPSFYLHRYPSFGSNRLGSTYHNATDNITGTYFTKKGYGYGTNITAYVYGSMSSARPTYRCMIYRENDSRLIGTTEEKKPGSTGWYTFDFEDTPILEHGVKYVITLWGDNTTRIYYYSLSGGLATGKLDPESYGDTPPDPANFEYQSWHIYSLFCSYTPETYPPQILNTSHNPDPAGFGGNITINVNATDNLSGIDFIKINITNPDDTSGNYTMSHVNNNWYQYLFSDTWRVGQYNYTIWAVDNSNNKNSSTGHHFQVSANATINICTIQNNYKNNEHINLTDPPEDNGNDDFLLPITTPETISENYQINYPKAWNYLLNRMNYTLEAKNTHDWYPTPGLMIHYQNRSNDTKKYTMTFNATQGTPWADYRINLTIDTPLQNYTRDTQNKTLHLQYGTYNLIYNYTDLTDLPGLTFDYGVHNNRFWFRITQTHVPNGWHQLDPVITIEPGTGTEGGKYAAIRRLIRSPDGTLYCVYHRSRGGANQINISSSTDNGATWTRQKITPDSTYPNQYPSICTDTLGNLWVFWDGTWSASGTGAHDNIRYIRYWKANTTWSRIYNLTNDPAAANINEAAVCAIDGNNNIHVTWYGMHNSSTTAYNIRYRKWTHSTDSWGSILDITNYTTAVYHQFIPTIAVDTNDNVHIAWYGQHASSTVNYQIRYRNSTNGVTWNPTVNITWGSFYDQAVPVLVINNSNYVNIVWQGKYASSGTGSKFQIRNISKNPNTAVWGRITNITTLTTEQNHPTITVDTADLTRVIWNSKTGGSYYQIYCKNCTGHTWGATWNLTTGSHHHYYPNAIYANYPRVPANTIIDRPASGFVFIYAENSALTYYNYSCQWNSYPHSIPLISNPGPVNNSTGITITPQLNITVNDPAGDQMNITWYSNSSSITMLILRPTGNGSSTELDRNTGNANYKCVDETPPNEDTDYVKRKDTTWAKDTYNLANHTSQTGTINSVKVWARCERVGLIPTPPTDSSAKIVLYSNGTYHYGSEFKPPYTPGNSVYTNYSSNWTENPATNQPWTWNDIDALQAGIAFIGNEGESRCTQLYVVVNFTDASSWQAFGQNTSITNGTYHQTFKNASVNGQWWYWKVNVNDGYDSNTSDIFCFYTGVQSKIMNQGNTTIKGYLLLQVQFYNETNETWIVANNTIDETTPRTITSGQQLALDTIFNGLVNTSDLLDAYGSGTYCVYAAFRDPDGTVLICDDETELETTWEFAITSS